MEKEIWKDIRGYKGHYQISNFGRVRSWKGHRMYKVNDEPKILKEEQSNRGYLRVHLSNKGRARHISVHRLVAEYFIPNPKDKCCINHKDGDKSNNHVDNLEWCNMSENMKHAYKIGLQEAVAGENHGQSKLTRDDILQIRSIYDQGFAYQHEISEAYGITQSHVSNIVNRKQWSQV